MNALSFSLVSLLILCLAFGTVQAGEVSPPQGVDARVAVWAIQETSFDNTWAGSLLPDLSQRVPILEVAMNDAGWNYGPLFEGYRHGVTNYYGYRPFGYFGYHPEIYSGYRAPGYYGYQYYFQNPAYLPGYRFNYRF